MLYFILAEQNAVSSLLKSVSSLLEEMLFLNVTCLENAVSSFRGNAHKLLAEILARHACRGYTEIKGEHDRVRFGLEPRNWTGLRSFNSIKYLGHRLDKLCRDDVDGAYGIGILRESLT
ncbi:hypothetical protein AVEN_201162-1 [Araneus ventricosus]|uniref:Uncharacterized protein n=1 Tax=Araneus ventricosus TaxID=182803 RepID=A0A4Y2QKZ3_ARAVE|nr:hypothetical protein AVEN_201162-1 [Araneus ventricosus]